MFFTIAPVRNAARLYLLTGFEDLPPNTLRVALNTAHGNIYPKGRKLLHYARPR